jgi:hypothetical protein
MAFVKCMEPRRRIGRPERGKKMEEGKSPQSPRSLFPADSHLRLVGPVRSVKERFKPSVCSGCFFRFAGKRACAAFPKGIPAAIAAGRFDHTRPYPNDGGIRFLSGQEVRALLHP